MANVSVIIPAYDEEQYIAQTIGELEKGDPCEIVVVDNGSTDKTADLARSLGVKVIEFPIGSIAAVRNRGVREATSDFLFFIDSDVRVTPDWHENLPDAVEKLVKNPLTITGARYQTTNDDSFLNRYWYSQLHGYEAQYINGGNMLTTRQLFETIGGFDESLETAEDYDFCIRAKQAGAIVFEDAGLKVIHDGYPQSIARFIQRERWLGKQDVASWRSFTKSKVAMVAALNGAMLLVALGFSLGGEILAMPLYIAVMYLISMGLILYKFGAREVHQVLIMPIAYYLYLCGRSLSIVDRLLKSS